MRPFLAALCLSLLAPSARADIILVRVWGSYRTADSFVRISEYFTGHENPGRGTTVLRTQPNQRGGYYFLTRVKNTGEPAAAKLQLQIITARSPEVVTYTFPVSLPHGQEVYEVGLTGADWPLIDEQPVAWKLSVLGNDGHEISSRQSFVWSKPDGAR